MPLHIWRGPPPLAETHPGTRSPGARTGCTAARCTGVGARKKQGLTRPQATTRRSPSAQASFRQNKIVSERAVAPQATNRKVSTQTPLLARLGAPSDQTSGFPMHVVSVLAVVPTTTSRNASTQTHLLAMSWAPSDQH